MVENTPNAPNYNIKKIDELESIRGMAALLVVFIHLPKWNPILDIGIINNAYLMVDLFFVLSGYVIFSAYSGKIENKMDLLRFQFLRFGRLYPVHILFLLVFVAIEFFRWFASKTLGLFSPTTMPFEINNFSEFVKSTVLMSGILPNSAASYNYPAWSISVEFYTYLVFAAVIFLIKRGRMLIFLTFCLVSLLMLTTDNTFGFYPLLRCFAGFFIGCLTAKLTENIKPTYIGFFSPIVFLILVSFIQLKTDAGFDALIYFLAATLIASLVLSPNGILNKILKFPFLTWLGAISYCVYMSHAAVAWAIDRTIRLYLKGPEVVEIDMTSPLLLSKLQTLMACLSYVIIVLLISALVHSFVEKPLRKWSRNFAFSQLK
jgi:peptidoglycan/LPS O-acetylase OafA/YrhL